MSDLDNIIYLTDSYKVSHHKQYPPGTETVYSYFESRGGGGEETVFFGLQYFLKRYLEGARVTAKDIDNAEKVFAAHFGDASLFNRKGWEYILTEHGGKLPVSIHAVPEGSVVPTRTALMTVENTDPECYWLTNYLETLLVQVWYPTTVATYSRECKKVVVKALEKTSDVPVEEQIGFKLHDFGFRGVSSVETAGLGGAAHLVNFLGTDTVAGLIVAAEYYNCPMAGHSIPAAEHSTMTSWGQENEADAYRNMLTQFGHGLVAVVSDSYDIYNAARNIWGGELKEQVENMDGALVVRPDSGNPPDVVVNLLEILGEKFGYTTNTKGFKVLNPKIRVIQGDGIDLEMLDNILTRMSINGWSADNLAFGSGGGLLQKHNRDTYKFACKCSSITVNGEHRDVFKNPVTDSGKKSKRGRFAVVVEDGKYYTLPEGSAGENQLVEVFRDGEVLVEYDLDKIRERAAL